MAYINLPPSLQALIDGIVQRLTKLENGQRFTLPNVPVLTSQPTVTGLTTGDPTEPRAGDAWLNTTSNAPRYVDAVGTTRTLADTSIASPAGAITAFGGTTAPTGWFICNGGAISRTTYAALFAVLSTAYGAGDGSTTFNLPNLEGRFPVGQDGSADFATNGQSGGNKTHSHTLSNNGFAQVTRAGNNMQLTRITTTAWTAADQVAGTGSAISVANRLTGAGLGGSTDATSGAASIPPYQVVRYIIKY